MTETDIVGGFEIISTYRCKNRIVKSSIRLTSVQFNKTCNFKKGYFITCDTHGEHKDDNVNHTEALFYMRKPWVWCDGCAEIHEAIEWICKNCSSDNMCPECDGSGEVSGDYFSDDGMTTCNRCNGKGTL